MRTARVVALSLSMVLSSGCGDSDSKGTGGQPVQPAGSILGSHLGAQGLFTHAPETPILGARVADLRKSFGPALTVDDGRHSVALPATSFGAGPQLDLKIHDGAVASYRFDLDYGGRESGMRDVVERALDRALGGRGREVQHGALACTAFPVPHDRNPDSGADCPPARFACERAEVAVCHSEALAAVSVLVARAAPPIARADTKARSLKGLMWHSDGRVEFPEPAREPSVSRLADGRILLIGGIHWERRSIEAVLYAPESGTIEAVPGPGARPRAHTATELADGSVLVVGGTPADVTRFHVSSAQVYRFHPQTRRWRSAPPLSQARYGHSAFRLPDGRVLVFGGTETGAEFLRTSEIYDPVSNRWSAGPSLHQGRWQHAAVRLQNGDILVAGSGESGAEMTSELYDVEAGTWTLSGALQRPWYGHQMTLLPDGRVWLVGESYARGQSRPHVASELYDPDIGAWTLSAVDERSWLGFATVPVAGGVLLVGGYRPAHNGAQPSAGGLGTGSGGGSRQGSAERSEKRPEKQLTGETPSTSSGETPKARADRATIENRTETLFFDPQTEKLFVGPSIPDTHAGDRPRAVALGAHDALLLARESRTALLLRAVEPRE